MLIAQSVYSCVYYADTSKYSEDQVLAPFMDALIYIANCFHFRGVRTQILRDEDITFPPTTDNFSPASNKFVKPYKEIIENLSKAIELKELKPYLSMI